MGVPFIGMTDSDAGLSWGCLLVAMRHQKTVCLRFAVDCPAPPGTERSRTASNRGDRSTAPGLAWRHNRARHTAFQELERWPQPARRRRGTRLLVLAAE